MANPTPPFYTNYSMTLMPVEFDQIVTDPLQLQQADDQGGIKLFDHDRIDSTLQHYRGNNGQLLLPSGMRPTLYAAYL